LSDVDRWERPFGARPLGEGRCEFRVWAPQARAVTLRLGSGEVDLRGAGSGVYECIVEASAGERYWFLVDGTQLPDPCSRSQPEGLRGPSQVVEVSAPARFATPSPADLVIHELHVGAFTPEGTFDGAIPHLQSLAELGITAIEIMPIAEFPGKRGWGYDGVYISSAYSAYGGPAGLQRLVEGAHEAGLAVVLDVVYNHVGASGVEALRAFGPYFTDAHETLWGPAIDFTQPAVRAWVAQSAVGWIRDFGIDGLRLDAVHAIFDPSPEHIVAEVARRVHAARPGALVIAEAGMTDPDDNGGYACDAAWVDQFHHSLHVLLTGERDGYYADFGRVADLAQALEQIPPERFVIYSQNHDQVGNRAFGDRLPVAVRPLAAFCTLLAQFVPLLFMGEEYGEPAPFQFFSDHIDKEIADATRAGRREEFASFTQFTEEIPDPQARETFLRSKLTRQRDPALAELYRELLAVRRELPPGPADVIEFDEDARRLRVRRGPFELVCNFSSQPARLPSARDRVRLATEPQTQLKDGHLDLPPMAAALLS